MLKCYHDGKGRFRRRQLAHRRGRRPLRRPARPALARRGGGLPARRLLAPRARGALPPLARRPPPRPGRPLRPGGPARARLHHHGHPGGALAAARRGRLPARARPQGEAAMSRRFRLALPVEAAGAVCGRVQRGETRRQTGLRPIATGLESEAVLVARPDLDDDQRLVAGELATVVRSVIDARSRRYLMLNAPDDSLDAIVDLLPGLDSPTVLPLARPGWHSVHAVVERRQVMELLGPLRAAGARSLLVLPIHHLIP